MKKYKIGKRIITADSMIAAVKIAKMLDSPNTRVKPKDSEIDELTQEEQQAVEDYREAIKNASNPKLLEIYSHILQEETEHLQELAKAKEVDDACGKMKDAHHKYRGADIYENTRDHTFMIEGFGETYSSIASVKAAIDQMIKEGIRFR